MNAPQCPLERGLSRLDNVKPSGDGYSACCPCETHNDQNNSLSVADGKVNQPCPTTCFCLRNTGDAPSAAAYQTSCPPTSNATVFTDLRVFLRTSCDAADSLGPTNPRSRIIEIGETNG